MGQHTIPIYPRGKVDIPNWINYEADGEVERNIKKRMRKCEKVGIWDLVWESSGASRIEERGRRRKKRRRIDCESESESDDQGREEEGRRRVSERGWVVLEWLVHIWEKDQEERGGESCSPSLSLFILDTLHYTRSSFLFPAFVERREDGKKRDWK